MFDHFKLRVLINLFSQQGIRCLSYLILASFSPMVSADSPEDPEWLRKILNEYSVNFKMPAVGASIVIDGEVVAASVTGVRKADDSTLATQGDRFHIGSIAKPVTVTMLARLIELGFFNWHDTIENMFPQLVEIMQPEYRQVSMEQLISHTSGMPYSPSIPESETDQYGTTLPMKRKGYVIAALKDKPEAPPGTKHIYGGGHILAANYAEEIMGSSYEDLMMQEIFEPLNMNSARFGSPATPGTIDGTWEHVMEDGNPKPVPPENNQFHQTRSPVGRNLCMSVIDLGKIAAVHLQGANGKTRFLKKETFNYLHNPVSDIKASPSWTISRVNWAKGKILWHGGSNLRNLAKCHIVPKENLAICLTTNIWYEGIDKPFDNLNIEIVKQIQAGRLENSLAAGKKR